MAREAKILLGNCFLYSDLWREKQGMMSEIRMKAKTLANEDIFHFQKRKAIQRSPIFFTRGGGRAKNFIFQSTSLKKSIDGLNYSKWSGRTPFVKIARDYQKANSITGDIFDILGLKEKFSDWTVGLFHGMPLSRAWNVSLASAMIFGMLSMTMVYRYLGQNVSARMQSAGLPAENSARQERVLGEEDYNSGIDPAYITKILGEDIEGGKELPPDEFEKKLREFVKGYPIEDMVPYIAKQNHITAAFMIAIAKKESAWGKRVPVLDGQDCFNYWGFRAVRPRMGTGGHTCFDNPEDAVKAVAKRIDFLVSKEGLDTPEKMIVWKCGYDCSWDSDWAVEKWIADVDKYFQQLNKE